MVMFVSMALKRFLAHLLEKLVASVSLLVEQQLNLKVSRTVERSEHHKEIHFVSIQSTQPPVYFSEK